MTLSYRKKETTMHGKKRDWTIEDLKVVEDAIQVVQHQLSVLHSSNELVKERASSVELVLRAALVMLREGSENHPDSTAYVANNLRHGIINYNLDVVFRHPGHKYSVERVGMCCGDDFPTGTGTVIVHSPQEYDGLMRYLYSEPEGLRYRAMVREHLGNGTGEYTAVFKGIRTGTYSVLDDWTNAYITVHVEPGQTVHVGQRKG
jgi:hypothetical protein